MKKIITTIAFILSLSINAKCLVTPSSVKVTWTGFKTPAKAGVKGILPKIKINQSTGKSIKEAIMGASFTIDASKVDSKNPARDMKIAKFVFSTLKGGAVITGMVKNITSKQIKTSMTINNVTKPVPLSYFIDGNTLRAKGTIDMLDFAMNGELSAINKACLAKHEGKTWSDVNIELVASFTGCK